MSDGRYPRGISQQPVQVSKDQQASRRPSQRVPQSQPQMVERIEKPYESPVKPPTQKNAQESRAETSPREKLRVNTTDLKENVQPQRRQVAQSAVEPRHQQSSRRPSGQTPSSARPQQPMSAVRRSSARAETIGGRDWAPDRSPLQKLEVTLNDISKEEKRARVQEAEMLLRETKARKASAGGSPNVATDDTGTLNLRKQRVPSSRSRDPKIATNPEQPPTIEDSGLVRSLSQTHRDRLQHSTTIDNHRPDARRLSADGKTGFEYSPAQPEREPAPVAYPSRTAESQSQPRRAISAGQPGSQAQSIRTVPAQQRSQGRPIVVQNPRLAEDSERRPLDRNASHKAALAKLAGADMQETPARSGSKKLQKVQPMDANSSKARQRGPPSNQMVMSDPDRQLQDQQVPQSLTPPPRIRDPNAPSGGSPPVSSPMSSMRPIGKRTSKSSVTFSVPVPKRPVDEWKEAKTARLAVADFALDKPVQTDSSEKGKAWWEESGSQQRRRRRSSASHAASTRVGDVVDDAQAEFRPRLFIRCGPLLRYLGLKRIKSEAGQTVGEVWRGSVLIVTQDSHSDYHTPPTLRLFLRPKHLLPPPPERIGGDLAPEYVDPIAGLTKMSRIGRPLYVRPVDHLDEEKDLSQAENDEGLFEASPSLLDASDHAGKTTASSNNRTTDHDGEYVGKFQEVQGARLYADPDRDVTFWRFNIEVELSDVQQHISYRINRGAASGFWVPALGQTMNIMFHSCNGFSLSVNPNQFSGPDPMWRDVLDVHQTRPFHVMIGGGDQIYNDRCTTETHHFSEWLKIRNPTHKHNAPFTIDMKEELESFYLKQYCTWFSQGLFSMANSQIPMVNIWDDHDIIDGFGSYPDHFMKTPVFSGLGNVAFKYYMLFQHQSVPEETAAHEPSWILGHEPGPYIHQVSRSVFMHLGKEIAFLGIDCRTERMRDEVLSIRTFDNLLERCRNEIVEGETKHLLVCVGVPIAYPRLVWLENMLTSRMMDPLKALNRMGVMKGGLLNKFDGGVEILDDLDDHWTASHHKSERNDLITDLQDLAAEKSVRITILSGDVHLAAVGQFRSNPKLKIPKDHDHRYMPNIISSAIVNTPPPDLMADVINKRNKVHTLNKYTEEDMIPMFTHDVDRKKRNNVHLLPRRNWCSIKSYHPGSTPPPTPPSTLTPSVNSNEDDIEELSLDQDVGAPRRRFSFSREPTNLLRKLSTKRQPPSAYPEGAVPQRSFSFDGSQPAKKGFLSRTFSLGRRSSVGSPDSGSRAASLDRVNLPPVRPGILRRPTNMSEKAARKGNVPAIDAEGYEIDVNDTINLDGGLDVVLNVEVNQKDPAGITTPYRLLVPALWYDGSSDREKLPNTPIVEKKGPLLGRMFSGRKAALNAPGTQGQGNRGQNFSDSESYSGDETAANRQQGQPVDPPRRRFSLFGSRRRRQEELYSSDEEEEPYANNIQNQGAMAAGFNQPPQNQHNTPVQRVASAPTPRGQGSYDPNRLPPRQDPRVAQRTQSQQHPQRRMQMPETHDALYDATNQPPVYHTSQRVPVGQSQQARQISTASTARQMTIGGKQRASTTQQQQQQQQQQQHPQVTMAAPRPAPGSAAGGLTSHHHTAALSPPPSQQATTTPRQHLANHGRTASDSYPIQSPDSESQSDGSSISSTSDVRPAQPVSNARPPQQQQPRATSNLHNDDDEISTSEDDDHLHQQATYPQPVPQRRPSKQERVLGIDPNMANSVQAPPGSRNQFGHNDNNMPIQQGPLRGAGIIGNFSQPQNQQRYGQQAGQGGQGGYFDNGQGRPGGYTGYSGIEAYQDPTPRSRRGFGSFSKKARAWLDGGGGR